MNTEELIRQFKKRGCSLTSRGAEKIGAYIKRMLPPQDEVLAI